ncbi:hypothetical protein AALP_AA8G116000, partial [Arabis alpina]
MYNRPTSYLVFFFLFSLFHPLPFSSSQLDSCDETLFQCGNITAGFPFWGVARHQHCARQSLGLHCNMDTTSIFISNQEFIVLQINEASNILRLARTDHLGLLSVSENPEHHITCHGSFTVNLPMSFDPEEKVFNLTHLESALREGFEVKVRIDTETCEECLSSHGRCGFNESSSLGVTCVPQTADELHKRCSGSFSCGDQKE